MNLGDLGSEGICAGYFPDDCDDVTLAWGLGSYRYTFYGETLDEVDQSSNSMIFGPEGWLGTACSACNQYLPEPEEINQIMAGLWRDTHPGTGGQGEFYGSLLTGLLANPADAVFYGNWQDVGQFGDPTITSRHAIAIVLDGQSEPAGRIYYIYDDITGDLTTNGFTVGVENKTGDMGETWGYAPCLGGSCLYHDPEGSPPANGTTLRLDPFIAGGDYIKTFTYQVEITADVGTLLTNRAEVTSTSPDPEVASMSAIADVSVIEVPPTWYLYLPVIVKATEPTDSTRPKRATGSDPVALFVLAQFSRQTAGSQTLQYPPKPTVNLSTWTINILLGESFGPRSGQASVSRVSGGGG